MAGFGYDELWWSSAVVLALYQLTALRGCSSLRTEEMKTKSREAIALRPYLQTPHTTCSGCGTLKLFRAAHCQFCKTCVAKHSRHSLVWGGCIGAANELLAMLFFAALAVTLGNTLTRFWAKGSYGLLTRVMFYLLNVPLCWMAWVECL